MMITKIILLIGVVSLAVGVVSRFMVVPVPPLGLEAKALLNFANSCFLLSIALALVKCKK